MLSALFSSAMAFLLYGPNYILSKLKVSLIPQKKNEGPIAIELSEFIL
jgi:hypothetical protein